MPFYSDPNYYSLDGFEPNYLPYDNYVYLLEAAAAGKGVGLGWRNLIERHLDRGLLLALGSEDVEFDKRMSISLAQKCLRFLHKC